MLSQVLGVIVLTLPLPASLVFAFMPERRENPMVHKRWRVAFIVAAVLYTAIVFWQQRLAAREGERDRQNAINETSERVSKNVTEHVRGDYQDTIKRQADKIGELQKQLGEMGKQVNVIRRSNIVTGSQPMKVEVTNPQQNQPNNAEEIKKRQEIREHLSMLMIRGTALRNRCITDPADAPQLDKDAEAWFSESLTYLNTNLGIIYVNQFVATYPEAITPANLPEKRTGLWHGLHERIVALNKFMDELK